MATVHQLKIKTEYFDEVKQGRKKAELRKADRDFSLGDFLQLREWIDYRYERQLLVKVTHILPVAGFILGGDDWVVISFEPITKKDIDAIIYARPNDAGESL